MKLFDNSKEFTVIHNYADFIKDEKIENTLMCICTRLAMNRLFETVGQDNILKMSKETFFANLNIYMIQAYDFVNNELKK